jgi:hypothetical protein
MAGKLFKMIVKHRRTGKAYMRYFKTRKGFNAAKKAGATVAKKGGKTPTSAASVAEGVAAAKAAVAEKTRRGFVKSVDKILIDAGKGKPSGRKLSNLHDKMMRANLDMQTKTELSDLIHRSVGKVW